MICNTEWKDSKNTREHHKHKCKARVDDKNDAHFRECKCENYDIDLCDW